MSSDKQTDDELDRLLRQARWPQPSDERLARLGERWQRARAVHRRRRFGLAGLALAASVLLVAGLMAWRPGGTGRQAVLSIDGQHAPEPQDPGKVVLESGPPVAPAPAGPWSVVPRDPNAYERVALIRMIHEPRRNALLAEAELVDELIAALAKDPDADIQERLATLPEDLIRWERRLAEIARGDTSERRLGAARLLSRIGTRRSVPLFAGLTADPQAGEAALHGLGRLASEGELARLASAEPDAELRRRLLRLLLERRTPGAVALYLEFVGAPAARSEALTVVAEMDDAPADQLLGYLDSPQSSTRLAAALALSRISDPTVVERLCGSVGGIGRQEALIALLLSQSEQAAGCLDRARQNLYLVASLHAAERRLDALQIPRGGHLP
jgi:hypothetical protein